MTKEKDKTIKITDPCIFPDTNIHKKVCEWKSCSNRTKVSKDVNKIIDAFQDHSLTIKSIEVSVSKPKLYCAKLSIKSDESDISGFNSLTGKVIDRFKELFNVDFVMFCATKKEAIPFIIFTYK